MPYPHIEAWLLLHGGSLQLSVKGGPMSQDPVWTAGIDPYSATQPPLVWNGHQPLIARSDTMGGALHTLNLRCARQEPAS